MSAIATAGFLMWPLYAFKIAPSYGDTAVSATAKYVCVWSLLVGILTASVGCYGFYFSMGFGQDEGKFNAAMLMISIYMVLFGVIGAAAEMKISSTFDKFGFLASRGGRGLANFFIGSIAATIGYQFSSSHDHVYWITIAGVYDMIVGFFLILTYTCVSTGQLQKINKSKDEDEDGDGHSQYRGLAASDADGSVSAF